MALPWATRKVLAIAPPITIALTRSSSASITSILSDTLAPPSTARYGRSTSPSSRDSTSISLAMTKPAPLSATNAAIPAVDAWARWAVPNASLT